MILICIYIALWLISIFGLAMPIARVLYKTRRLWKYNPCCEAPYLLHMWSTDLNYTKDKNYIITENLEYIKVNNLYVIKCSAYNNEISYDMLFGNIPILIMSYDYYLYNKDSIIDEYEGIIITIDFYANIRFHIAYNQSAYNHPIIPKAIHKLIYDNIPQEVFDSKCQTKYEVNTFIHNFYLRRCY